jgi:flagellar assembly protein FliH
MAEIIPKEKQTGFQRWQIGSFDKPKPEPAPAPAQQIICETNEQQPDEEAPQFSLPTAEDIERIHEEARSSGYQDGYEEGLRTAEQACREAAKTEAERFCNLIDSLQKALDELDQNVADQLLALATEIAAQVVRSSISVKTDLLLPIIREAITALPLHHTHLTLRLNPQDAALVRPLLGEQMTQSGTQIIEDSEISPGGCQVRAGSSEVDATIETRWKRVIEAIGAEPQAWLNN